MPESRRVEAGALLYPSAPLGLFLATFINFQIAGVYWRNSPEVSWRYVFLSGLIPVPGGIGAAEATLSAGLIAMGVDESTAFALAITQRLCTFYLPPIWGYFALRWLSRNGYV